MDGLGVMLRRLMGQVPFDMAQVREKVIASIELADDALQIVFTDGATLKIADAGQSCCESRYMRTDDALSDFVGATIDKIEVSGVETKPKSEDDYEDHEIQFVRIVTSKGPLVLSSHNEHNGYYGGFSIEATFTEAE